MTAIEERHVLGLDLIRFSAAAMVMAFHYRAGWFGWVGVEVFFVLSGYVIAASSEAAPPWTFARNRVVRLMPAIWLCSAFTAAVCLVQQSYPDLASRFVNSLVLWPVGPWVDRVFWTLPVEVVFYGLVFLCLLGKAPLAWLLRLIAVMSAAYWATRGVGLYDPGAQVFGWASDGIVALSMLGFGCYFAAGGLMREGLKHGWTVERVAFMLLGVAAGAVQIAFTASNWPPHSPLFPHAQKIVPLAVWIVAGALMAGAVMANGALWRWIAPAAPLIRLLGLATYPVYLLHDAVGNALRPFVASPLAAMALTIGLGMGFAATIEPWAQRRLKAILAAFPWFKRARSAEAV